MQLPRVMAPALATSGLSGHTGNSSTAWGALDGIPIAKEILSAAAQVSQLAETINTNREALHDLRNRSAELGQLVHGTLRDRTPGQALVGPLNDIFEAISAVEHYMEKYRDKKPYRKLLSIIFRAGEVERLKDDLWNAKKKFKVAAALDTNIHVVATHKVVKSDAHFDGGIFNLHDAEVDTDGSIFKLAILESGPTVQYHRATVRLRGNGEGKLLVVRIVDRPTIPPGEAADEASKRLEEYDEILSEMTAPACQHRYVAKIFGRSDDEPLRRFTVLKLDPALTSGTKFVLDRQETDKSTEIALKLMDAAAHLSRHGIDWVPQNNEFRVDQNGDPVIGLDMDLHKKDPEKAAAVYLTQMNTVFALYEKLPSWKVRDSRRDALIRLGDELPDMLRKNPSAVPVACTLAQMLGSFKKSWKVVITIPKSHLAVPNLRLHGADDYLAAVNAVLGKPAPFQISIWARIMDLLAKDSALCADLRADYCLSATGDSDKIVLTWLNAGPANYIHLEMLYLDICDGLRDEARARFNITHRDTDSPSIRLFDRNSPPCSTGENDAAAGPPATKAVRDVWFLRLAAFPPSRVPEYTSTVFPPHRPQPGPHI